MFQYFINHVAVLDYAKRVRDAHTTYNKWCKTCDDPNLSADIFKSHAQFDAIANILHLRPDQLWSIVRTLERAGYSFINDNGTHFHYYADSARLFNRAFKNAKK